MRISHWLLAACLACLTAPASATVDLDAYLKPDLYETIKISPSGAYYAATVTLPDRTALVVTRRSDRKLTARASGAKGTTIGDFYWVNDERLVIAVAEKTGRGEAPVPTGELYGVNADGSGARMLVGHSDPADDGAAVFNINPNFQFAELIDPLPRDDRSVLVAMSNYDYNPVTRVVRMDVEYGRISPVATAPLHRATFATDADGVVRFAVGHDRDNYTQLLYRDNDKAPWRSINEEKTSGHVEWPIGFSADNKTAYLRVQQAQGPDALVAFEPGTGQRTPLLRDAVVDPEHIIVAGSDQLPVGASFVTDRRRSLFFDEQSDAALVQRTLEAAFPEQSVVITSATKDGQLLVVLVSSDTNPGDFYLYNRKTQAADGIFSRPPSLDKLLP